MNVVMIVVMIEVMIVVMKIVRKTVFVDVLHMVDGGDICDTNSPSHSDNDDNDPSFDNDEINSQLRATCIRARSQSSSSIMQ